MRRSFEERLNIVSQAKAGKPIRKLSREHGLHEDKILECVRKYDLHGKHSATLSYATQYLSI